MKRTRPKGDPDPGWVRISWDEALDTVAGEMRQARRAVRPRVRRVRHHHPERHRDLGLHPVGGAPDARVRQPQQLLRHRDLQLAQGPRRDHLHLRHRASAPRTGRARGACCCGATTRARPGIAQARQVADARARGAKLVVVDPRRAGAANKADVWLRVRPGTGRRPRPRDRPRGAGGSAGTTATSCATSPTPRILVHGTKVEAAAGRATSSRAAIRIGSWSWNTGESERAQSGAARRHSHGAPWALEGEVTVRDARRAGSLPHGARRVTASDARRIAGDELEADHRRPGRRHQGRGRAASPTAAPSPTTPGPASGSTPTRPRPIGPSPASTR